jgi:hypothetical protein
LEPKEWVIITVIGGESESGCGVSSSSSIVVRDEGREISVSVPGLPPVPPIASDVLTGVGYSGPTVLTIRAKGSDIEAFWAGKLDFEQFGQRVQIFSY